MKRAAIYARFSSDLQSDRSIDDQIAACRELCGREGWSVVAIYSDRAMSGTNASSRPEFQAMIEAAAARQFSVIVVEDLDRLSRDQSDYHAARKRLDFAGVSIHTLSGKVTKLEGSLRALMGEMFIDNLIIHTRRGMEGVVRDGRHAGGRAYGYMPVTGKPGELAIVESEAEVLRGIFADYVVGKTPRQIAKGLNERGIRPPRGSRWNASTINGNLKRGTGILLNDLYAGRIVWNKVRMVKDLNGKRISKANDKSAFRSSDAPYLRIIDEQTWAAAQAIKQAKGGARPHDARKPRRLLSGLMICAECEGSMISAGGNYRDARIKCSRHRETGMCDNGRKFSASAIERRVLSGLREHLTDPAVIAEYVAEYNRERTRLARSSGAKLAQLERSAGENKRAMERAIDAILKMGIEPEAMAARIKELEAERLRLATEIEAAKAAPQVIALHPASIERYRADVAALDALLQSGQDEGCDELVAAVRGLVASVVIGTDGSIEVQGLLSQLIDQPAYPAFAAAGTRSMVAGGRLHRSSPLKLPTYRFAA